MPQFFEGRRWLWPGIAVAVLAAAIVFFGGALANRAYLDEAAARGQTTLRLAVAALAGQMNRFEPLPELIADHEDIKELVSDPDNPVLRARANDYLKEINALLKSSDIYVLIPGGETIAASNHDLAISFVGENFSYRPYYQDAIRGNLGRFFALGTTSLKRGYYFSSPIRVGMEIRGVVVFKVDIDAIEASWKGGDHEIIVTDPEGIIFMSGRPDWLYASLTPLTDERRARTETSRRYADAMLRELPVIRSAADDGQPLLRIAEDGKSREFLELAEEMPEARWTVRVLADTASAHAQALTAVISALLALGLAALGGAVVLQRRARLAERMQMQQSAQVELERRVDERTADLALVNSRLETEVAERRTAEQQLRQTQADLIQAGKLAALGQMSAALSHEFNQPLAAVKTYAENAATLIDRARIEEARDNVSRISSLADRMASISRHLRNFARKPNQKLGAVALDEVVHDTEEIVAWRLKAADASLSVDLGPTPPAVKAGSVRLQQVLVNIVTNAADAVEGRSDRRIELVARRKGSKVTISVRDHGPGVPPAIAERIFDPFFSTKGVGKGLGLGLSISYNIVKDFGGSLGILNHPEGGALFTIELDAARAAIREAAE
ncbi:two-component system C4-dicarboxylate transport sensor histidine kinase DctB [Aminobacter aminovorans]|uniref:C4-dicarboxylate transport sensor protein DctB n=1 Tax=Aminobacter aminovorans TaxID=83263 RepID=A0A380WMV2_AMIAI|nr:sensor histidine kinase [Aminobacter aminovorans]TCS26069.1 two-component system C4-dicarboxylate transport sensor histidine kinase DctB [Aminobacter aminovorans]SUU90267.1 C4-dicarboxylate transport sensor protein dctB [Aminobacter aminovorans]